MSLCKWKAQVERGIRLEVQRVQVDSLLSLAAQEQGLGAFAGHGPALDEGIEVNVRVDPQDEHPQRLVVLRVENWHQKGQMNGSRISVVVEIQKDDLVGSQAFSRLFDQRRRDRLWVGRGGKREALHASGIEQEDAAVPGEYRNFFQPG